MSEETQEIQLPEIDTKSRILNMLDELMEVWNRPPPEIEGFEKVWSWRKFRFVKKKVELKRDPEDVRKEVFAVILPHMQDMHTETKIMYQKRGAAVSEKLKDEINHLQAQIKEMEIEHGKHD